MVNVPPVRPQVPVDGVEAWKEPSLDLANFHLRTMHPVLGYRVCFCPNGCEKLNDEIVN